MNDHATAERQAIIASTAPATEVELRLNEQLAFERARADRMETAIREVLLMCPGMSRRAQQILGGSLTR